MRARHLALAAAALSAGCGGGQTTGPKPVPARVVVSAPLTPPAAGAAGASGRAVLTLRPRAGRACWTLAVHRLRKPLSAHVHRLVDGDLGRVVIPLGDRFARDGCVVAPVGVLRAVAAAPRDYAVVVYSRDHLDGALRGGLNAGG